MIVVETLLKDIFSQIPTVVDSNGKEFPVKFHWGGQEDLNLYMKQESGNKTPLIWLVEGKDSDKGDKHILERNVTLIIAKNSAHKTARNPVVWESEFETYLIPLFEKVLKCLTSSGVTRIINGEYDKTLRANYSEEESGNETKTIDHWNVIVFDARLVFEENPNGTPKCINQIYFKTT